MTGVQTETGVLAGDERMLIDGELQFTGSGAKFDVVHPASEEVAGQATDGTVADMERAVGAARRAFDEGDWSRDLEFRDSVLPAAMLVSFPPLAGFGEEASEVRPWLLRSFSEIVILGVEEPQSARRGISDVFSEQENDLLLLDHTLDVELGLAIRHRAGWIR